jgi:hypothetical protein
MFGNMEQEPDPPSLITIGEDWLLISFLTGGGGGHPPSLICLATGDLVY